jgi:predicted nucleotidyltransferase component of viral defense system
MLHFEAIEPITLSILKELMALPSMNSFALAGGTALALKYGHRQSVDLDLFSHNYLDQSNIRDELIDQFGSQLLFEEGHKKWALFCFIRDVKVDIIHYPHHLIDSIQDFEGLRLYSDKDISAMKIQAILGRAQKKDFYDLYELLQHHSLEDIVDWHKAKYPNQMLAISIPNALTYFPEAENSETPFSLKGQNWNQVKEGISRAVSVYLQ